MKQFFSVLFILTFLSNSGLTQTFNHNTGNIQVSVFQNGYIGHGGSGAGGNGVVFLGSPDACYTAGVMYGNSTYGVSGMIGSFTDGTNVLIQDLVNTVPISNYSLPPYFNQVSSCQFKDNLAPVPYGLTVNQTTYSNTGDDFVFIRYDFTNTTSSAVTNFYVGLFNDWDIGLTNYLNNRAGIDAARSLVYQWLGAGTINDPNYYGLVAFNGMAGGTASSEFPGDGTTIRFVIKDWISSITQPLDITEDYRSFIGSGPYSIGVGGTLMVGFGIVAGQNLADLQANTDAAQALWDNFIVPVELTSFTGNVNNLGQVVLNWETATEINNQGFEIERRTESSEFRTVGFVEGHGSTTETQSYVYTDATAENGINFYRLKQIDFNGTYEYSDEIEVDVNGPLTFDLAQNYPNPFNPTTNIKYSVSETGNIKLSVYNTVGEEVAVLVDGFSESGFFEVSFNASGLPSGVYLYKLQSANSVQTKKMMLLK